MIGTFAVALTLGILLGLICGVQYTRTVIKNKLSQENKDISKNNVNLNKGLLYEDIDLDKNIPLAQNVSYDAVKL